MLIIEHRVNTVAQLKKVPIEMGVEVDLRQWGDEIILNHKPFSAGETLEEFLQEYRHRFIIFNPKCDGLEERIIRAAEKHHIKDFFFLDLPAPTMVKLARKGIRKLAVRFSEYEPIEGTLAFAGLAEWAWVDCFNSFSMDGKIYESLRKNFKICMVSPELQGRPREEIAEFRQRLASMPVDAACTDYPGDWGFGG